VSLYIVIRRLQDISISLYSCFRPAYFWIRAFECQKYYNLYDSAVLCIARSTCTYTYTATAEKQRVSCIYMRSWRTVSLR